MKSVCFFNNKGGVGKTTLVCNIAAYIAEHFDYKVLLVDADPQCNATQLLLDADQLEALYRPVRRKGPLPLNRRRFDTLFDVLTPIARGDSDISSAIKPGSANGTRFGIDLVAGHPKLALLEDRLSQAWIDFGSGDLGGARRTNWSSQLLKKVKGKYDLAFFDIGPSLGALNRTVLVGVDYFLTPMGCDIFSIMGITNISDWLSNWRQLYDRAIRLCRDQWASEVGEYVIRDFSKHSLKYAGYTVQQYITKSKEGVRRPTKAYEQIMGRIPGVIRRELSPFIPTKLDDESLRLGDVPNMFSLVPLAQDNNAPIHGLEGSDGLVGAQYSQKEAYVGFIADLATHVLRNLKMRTTR